MFRKEEAAVTDWSEATVAMCAARQQDILASAAEMLAPGGRLVYSTCTFSPEENEGVISAFLHAHPAFSVEPVEAPWFSPARPDWISDPAPGLEHAFRLWPHCLRGEGHFAAVLRSHADGARQDVPTERPAQLPAAAADFLRSCTQPMPDGVPVCFGSVCYLAPAETPALSGLRVLRAGLELGELRRDRFSPAHALALWLHTYPQTADFPAGGRLSARRDAARHAARLDAADGRRAFAWLGTRRGRHSKESVSKGPAPSALTASLAFSPPNFRFSLYRMFKLCYTRPSKELSN